MSYFELPKTTIVNRFIPKNAFDEYTNSSQKKRFSDKIEKITWLNKLSKETMNLDGSDVNEIQIFEIKLKVKENILQLLNIIDKAIPYHIIFVLKFGEETYLSTSKKHNHINNENTAVIDWNFCSEWHYISNKRVSLQLKESIDFIYTNFCSQISGFKSKNIKEIIENDSVKTKLKRQIEDLENKIKKEKQFNLKVEMNEKLKNLKKEFKTIDLNQKN
ncbi:MAG: DUF4391 domain-containing protein [Flavobacteriaceae bacterium]|jgi:hypothetical protein|nr:DUF4391 domain-containing protein [Flavobacteriaceae bacterium]